MKAYTKKTYGGPQVLKLDDVARPATKEGHILVKVHANSANPADWHILRGKPFFARLSYGLFKPKNSVPGADFSGIVEEVGANVSQFKVGDRVFGGTLSEGAFAELKNVPAGMCAIMPENGAFQEMAAVAMAGATALQALITHGKLEKGESVLINGSSGGVGHLAVQIAKAYGGYVTAVCSSKKVDFVRSLGADQVIAYDRQNIHKHAGQYDLIIDTHGNLSFDDYQRMGRRGVMVGFTSMKQMMSLIWRKAFSRISIAQFTADPNTADLTTLASLVESGKIKVHIEKIFSYREIPLAISHIEGMKTSGKVAMVWENTSAKTIQ